ncbi:MAG: hypothetical protein Q4D38_14350 [Planctomycetia bacterium]|nr:hypothetical protein [Planctomycetia bacterium]
MQKTIFCLLLFAFISDVLGQDPNERLSNDAAAIYHNFKFNGQNIMELFTPEEEENWKDVSAELLPSLNNVLSALEDEMSEISQAAKLESCQWRFPFKEDGILTDIEVLVSLNFMSQCFLANARKSMEERNPEDAVSNILTAFRLARHVGNAATLSGKTIQWKMEESGLFFLFLHREDFTPEQKKYLYAELLQLHTTSKSILATLALEEEWFYPWVRGNFIFPYANPQYPMFENFAETIRKHSDFSANNRENLCVHYQNYYKTLSLCISCSENDLQKEIKQLKTVMIDGFMYPYTSSDVVHIRKCERENQAYWKMVLLVFQEESSI